jgi:hypothetical protein
MLSDCNGWFVSLSVSAEQREVYVFLFLFSVKHMGIVGLGFQFDILDCITFLAPRNTHGPSEIIKKKI